jgi:hypothetical protein
MAITSTVPNIFSNGVVMSSANMIENYNHIKDDVNANAQPTQTPIVQALPYGEFIPEELTDANKVMANFEHIRTQINDRATLTANIDAFPHNLQNGNGNDAIQVNENFEHLVTEINAKITAIPAATKIAVAYTDELGGGSTTTRLRTYAWDGSAWVAEGSAFVFPSGTNERFYPVTTISANTIALSNNNNDSLETYQYDGATWSKVGNSFLHSENWTGLGSFYQEDNKVTFGNTFSTEEFRAFSWDGTDYSQDGNTYVLPDVSSFSVGSDGISSGIFALGYTDDVSSDFAIEVASWDGTNFTRLQRINTGFASGTLHDIATLSEDRFAACTQNGFHGLRVYDYTGASIVQVGNAFTNGNAPLAVTALSSTQVAYLYTNGTDMDLITLEFDGTNWTQVGATLTVTETDIDTARATTIS